ncbi:hypothetical protein HZB78_05350 [Candidatus Collierbacteria bacterium]|nr:hypothetical protein [Candidatus Collierbacteria bacterium]
MKLKLAVLFGIFIFGTLLRTVNLESNPANLSPAELELGMYLQGIVKYNAGLLRLPFAIVYSLTIPVTVFLIWSYAGKTRRLISDSGLWTGLFLAVSPWHILLSRRAEAPWNYWGQVSLNGFLERFMASLSPEYLFFTGDPVFLLTGNSGLLLSITLILVFVSLIWSKKIDRLFYISLFLILSGSILGSLAVNLGDSRPLMMSLWGWTVMSGWAASKISGKTGIGLMILVFSFQTLTTVQNIFIHAKRTSESQPEYILKSVAEYVVENQKNYQKIVVLDIHPQTRNYLIWYSANMVDKNKLVVDRFRNEFVDAGILYIGKADELDRRIGGLTTIREFFLPGGARILAAGIK